jgi:chromosome segregation ATPase
MSYSNVKHEWTKKGCTVSDKTAFKEWGLTQDDIIKAINEGKLQFREGCIYGNPYLRLLTSEVEKIAEEKMGKDLFNKKKAMKELKKVDEELKDLKSKVAELEIRKKKLTNIIKA